MNNSIKISNINFRGLNTNSVNKQDVSGSSSQFTKSRNVDNKGLTNDTVNFKGYDNIVPSYITEEAMELAAEGYKIAKTALTKEAASAKSNIEESVLEVSTIANALKYMEEQWGISSTDIIDRNCKLIEDKEYGEYILLEYDKMDGSKLLRATLFDEIPNKVSQITEYNKEDKEYNEINFLNNKRITYKKGVKENADGSKDISQILRFMDNELEAAIYKWHEEEDGSISFAQQAAFCACPDNTLQWYKKDFSISPNRTLPVTKHEILYDGHNPSYYFREEGIGRKIVRKQYVFDGNKLVNQK